MQSAAGKKEKGNCNNGCREHVMRMEMRRGPIAKKLTVILE